MSRVWPNGGTTRPAAAGTARPDQTFRSTNEFGTPHELTGTHRGIDLIGFDWIRAVDDGKVVFSGNNGTAGYEIKIRHTDLTSTRYLHMEYGSLRFITGQYVKKGDIIGKMGATGYVTGKHLHFECIDANSYTRINPRNYINPGIASDGGSRPFEPEVVLPEPEIDQEDFMLFIVVRGSAWYLCIPRPGGGYHAVAQPGNPDQFGNEGNTRIPVKNFTNADAGGWAELKKVVTGLPA